MTIMKIYEKLLKLGVFTLNDVINIYGNRNSAASAIKALLKSGLASRIKKNLYVCNNIETKTPVADKFKIGSSITENAYISHHSALEFHGVGHQLFFEVYVSSNLVFKPFEFDGISYKYSKSKTMEGVETYATNRGLRVTNLERTIIDCLNELDKAGGLEELLRNLSVITFLDAEKLMKYLKLYDIQFLFQKTGYILEYFRKELKLPDSFIDFCHDNIGKSKRYFGEKSDKDLVYNSKWRIFVNKNLFELMEQGGNELV
jgi:predicted transcriptional regulator of viral defense system